MKHKDDDRFPLPLLLLITAVSFLIFSLIIRLLDGSPSHAGLFVKVGIAALALSLVSFVRTLALKSSSEE
jgi:hypothetical protein